MNITLAAGVSQNISIAGGRFYFVDGDGRIRVKLKGSGDARDFDLYPRQGINSDVRFAGLEVTNISDEVQTIEIEISDREVFDNRIPEVTQIEPVEGTLPVDVLRRDLYMHRIIWFQAGDRNDSFAGFTQSQTAEPFLVTGVKLTIDPDGASAVPEILRILAIVGVTPIKDEDTVTTFRAWRKLVTDTSGGADSGLLTDTEIFSGSSTFDYQIGLQNEVFAIIQPATVVGGKNYYDVSIDLAGREVIVNGGDSLAVGVQTIDGALIESDMNNTFSVSYYGYYL